MSSTRISDFFTNTFPYVKGFTMFHQFIWQTIVLKKQVSDGIPRMYDLLTNEALNQTQIVIATASEHDEPETIYRPPVTEDMYSTYKGSAIAYSFFYVVGILCTIAFWAAFVIRSRKKRPNFMFLTTLIMVACHMPAMVAEMYMLKSQGVISWYDDWEDLVLQFIYCLNGFANVFMDLFVTNFDKTKDCFGTLIVGAVSFLLMNIFYTPVMWALVGWYWIGIFEVTSMHEPVFVGAAREALNTLVLLGHFGQFVSFSIAIIIIVCIVAVKMEKKKKPIDEKMNPFGIDMRNERPSETLHSINEEGNAMKPEPAVIQPPPVTPGSDLVNWNTVKHQMDMKKNGASEQNASPATVTPQPQAATVQDSGSVPWQSIKMEMEKKKMVHGEASPPPPAGPLTTPVPNSTSSTEPPVLDWQAIKLEMERKEQMKKSPGPPRAQSPSAAAPVTLTSEQDIELWQSIKLEMEKRKAAQSPGPTKSVPLKQSDVTPDDSVMVNDEKPVEPWKSIKQEMEKKKESPKSVKQESEPSRKWNQSMKTAMENNQVATTNNLADHHLS